MHAEARRVRDYSNRHSIYDVRWKNVVMIFAGKHVFESQIKYATMDGARKAAQRFQNHLNNQGK